MQDNEPEKSASSSGGEEEEGGDQVRDNQVVLEFMRRDRYIMDFGGSIQFCTLNMFLHFYNLAPKNKINIKLTNISWVQLLKNSLAINLIRQNKWTGKSHATTLSGQHLLWVCVDDEKYVKDAAELDDDRNRWVLEDCFKMLIKQDQGEELTHEGFDGCDMDIKDNFDEILINHAVKTFKNKSLKLMLKKGVDFELANEKGITAVGQAMVSKNAEALDLLLEHGADIHKNSVIDLRVSTKRMKPLHYFAKLIRLRGVESSD